MDITNIEENAAREPVVYKYSDPDRGRDRRKTPPGQKKRGFQVAEMWESHHEIARRIILGEKNVDIARIMNISEQQVSNVRNSPVVMDKLAIMSAARDAATVDLAKEILELAPIAIRRVKEALEKGTVKGKELSAAGILKEANGIIDREIGKPTQTINTRNLHGYVTPESLVDIKEQARKLAASSGQLAE